MLALVLTSSLVASGETPGAPFPKRAANILNSMGVDVIFYDLDKGSTAAIFDAIINDIESASGKTVDMIVVPSFNSSVSTALSGIREGQLSQAPYNRSTVLFLLNISTASGPGVDARDGTAGQFKVKILSTGGTIYTDNKHFTLDASASPILVQGLVVRDDDPTLFSNWKYSPDDGVNWVYCDIPNSGQPYLHLLMQEAINDGLLAAPPRRSPCILTIDHWSGDGDGATPAGTKYQPNIIKTVGDILRGANGVSYASLEQDELGAFLSAEQLANLQEYSDVFKYIATHDHGTTSLVSATYLNPGAGARAPYDSQETVASIVSSYDSTVAAIEAAGLVADTALAHFANNNVGTNWYQANVEQGWGFKVVRMSSFATLEYSMPPLTTDGWCWLTNRTVHRGTPVFSSGDAGPDNGAEVSLTKDLQSFQRNLKTITENNILYHHEADFEIAADNATGLISDGTAYARGLLCYQTGAAYQAACPDTFNFGANIDDYF